MVTRKRALPLSRKVILPLENQTADSDQPPKKRFEKQNKKKMLKGGYGVN